MCVIAVKKQGADFPSKKVITACMKENPHGFAAAWNHNGRLMTFRTMDEAEMIAKYDEIRRLDPAATALVFHARIATHGSKTLANCHCWTNDDGTLAFAHNGVLDNIQVCGDMTDSETFFRDIYLPVLEGAGPDLLGIRGHGHALPNGQLVEGPGGRPQGHGLLLEHELEEADARSRTDIPLRQARAAYEDAGDNRHPMPKTQAREPRDREERRRIRQEHVRPGSPGR